MLLRKVSVLGAGLVGSLLAIILKKKGYEVDVYERRPDMRRTDLPAGRSINLAMSTRGWRALELAGLREEIEHIAIPMFGRQLHQPDGSTAFQQYSKNNEAIYSVSRGGLNKTLMTLAEQEGAKIHFDTRCQEVDIHTNTLKLENTESGKDFEITADLLFGADGAHSALRRGYTYKDRVNAEQYFVEYGYKELNFPPGENGEFMLEKNALHIWPRGQFMLIALPNPDGSFTGTLFMPFEGKDSFEELRTDAEIVPFFQKYFADAIPLMPEYLHEMHDNQTASLITTYIDPWHHEDKSAVIGDAAHAVVPFYGQGMNAGFEDCSVLAGLIDENEADWAVILKKYTNLRKPNGDAVAALALQNFVEMRDKVSEPSFLERKKIEKELGKMYPDEFISVYEMVSFTHTPYSQAMAAVKAQDALLETIMAEGNFTENMQQDEFQARLATWISGYSKRLKHSEREEN